MTDRRDNTDKGVGERSGPGDGPTRRTVVRRGVKLAFTAPVLSTFFASQAYAANYSCYAQSHECVDGGPNAEPCCDTLTCQADAGSGTGFSCQP